MILRDLIRGNMLIVPFSMSYSDVVIAACIEHKVSLEVI